jgi:hypothetical protein
MARAHRLPGWTMTRSGSPTHFAQFETILEGMHKTGVPEQWPRRAAILAADVAAYRPTSAARFWNGRFAQMADMRRQSIVAPRRQCERSNRSFLQNGGGYKKSAM